MNIFYFLICIFPLIPAGIGYIRLTDLIVITIFGINFIAEKKYNIKKKYLPMIVLTAYLIIHYVLIGGELSVTLGLLRNIVYFPFGYYAYRKIKWQDLSKIYYWLYGVVVIGSLMHIYFPISRYLFGTLYPDKEWNSSLYAAPTTIFGDTTYNIIGLFVIGSIVFNKQRTLMLINYLFLIFLSLKSGLLSYTVLAVAQLIILTIRIRRAEGQTAYDLSVLSVLSFCSFST